MNDAMSGPDTQCIVDESHPKKVHRIGLGKSRILRTYLDPYSQLVVEVSTHELKNMHKSNRIHLLQGKKMVKLKHGLKMFETTTLIKKRDDYNPED